MKALGMARQSKAASLGGKGAPLLIEHENLDDKIYARLKRMIADGQLAPGQRILQEKLARDMGVSRTPLVNALKRLAQERLVEWVSRRGIYVKQFSLKEMAQLFEVREGLEPIAARLAATRISPAEVRAFKKVFDGFSKKPSAAEVRRYLKCDRHFHWRLVELTENPHLAAAMESVNMMISAYQVGVPRSLAESLPEHQAILHALGDRDPDASEAAMRIHIRRSVERLWSRARTEEPDR
jgi:GntR family transcriptional regulator, rspAB operon transcriptional repressor